jgi:hypothetical protein
MNPMLRTPTRARSARFVGALVVVAVAAACSGGDEEAVPTPAPPSPIATPAPSAGGPATVPATTAPATSAPEAPGTAPATVASTAPPTTAAPTAPPTTEPLSVQELVLSGDGLGSAVFGAEADGVIDYVTSILGGNTADTGWVAPDSFAVCDGTIARRVDWGTLSLLFTDLSAIANGRRHFIGYEYGRVGEIGDEPVGLRTPGGITLGSRVVDLLAEFPDAAVNEGDPQVGIPDNFYVSNVFYGLLTGTTADDYVTVLFGGYGCGE